MEQTGDAAGAVVMGVAYGWFFYCGAWFIAYCTSDSVGLWIASVRPYLFGGMMLVYAVSAYLAENKERLRSQAAALPYLPVVVGLLFFAVNPFILIGYYPLSFVSLLLYLGLLVASVMLTSALEVIIPSSVLARLPSADLLAGGVSALAAVFAIVGIPVLLQRGAQPGLRAMFGDPIFRGRVAQLAESYGLICTGVAAVAVWNGDRSWFSDVDEAAWKGSMRLKGGIGLLIGLSAAVIGGFGGTLESGAVRLSRAGALQMAEGRLAEAEKTLEAAYAECPSCLAAPARLAVLAHRRNDEAAFTRLSLAVAGGIAARTDAAQSAHLPALSSDDEQAIQPMTELLTQDAVAEARDVRLPLTQLPAQGRRTIGKRCERMSWTLEALRRMASTDTRVPEPQRAYATFCASRTARAGATYQAHPESRVFDDETSPFSGPILLSESYARALDWFLKSHPDRAAVPAPASPAGILKWFETTSGQGDPVSSLTVGELGRLGQGVKKDGAVAYRFYRLAAGQGSTKAMQELGAMFEQGDGLPKDLVQADIWYSLASAHSHLSRLDDFVRVEDRMNDQERGAASRALHQLSAKGDLYAAYSLSQRRGGPPDALLIQAAQGGVPAAQSTLGRRYADSGPERDPVQALSLLSRAADHYDCDAMATLGGLYQSGKGVPEDNLRAYMWFTLAAEHTECQTILPWDKNAFAEDFVKRADRLTQDHLKNHPRPYDW